MTSEIDFLTELKARSGDVITVTRKEWFRLYDAMADVAITAHLPVCPNTPPCRWCSHDYRHPSLTTLEWGGRQVVIA